MIIQDELDDFDAFWGETLFDTDGMKKNPGESDYTKLISWAKGNSFSVDHSTIAMGRRLMSLLVERLKFSMMKHHDFRHWDDKAGATLTDLQKIFSMEVRMGKKYRGKVNEEWFRIESMLQLLFKRKHIEIYQSRQTLINKSDEAFIRQKVSETTSVNGQERMFISEFLRLSSDNFGHIRLNHVGMNWDTYIRDKYGSPPGIENVLPGNLNVGLGIFPKHLEIDLHLAYGETISRKVSQFSGSERGLKQYETRIKICNAAMKSDNGMITLDTYYRFFRHASAEHMADYYLLRSVSDRSAAWFNLHEVKDSNPKKWLIEVDPDLIRWREYSRDRSRERDADVDEEQQTGGIE